MRQQTNTNTQINQLHLNEAIIIKFALQPNSQLIITLYLFPLSQQSLHNLPLPAMPAYQPQTQAQQQDHLATMSKRIKSNPNIMASINKFYEATMLNQDNVRMIEQDYSSDNRCESKGKRQQLANCKQQREQRGVGDLQHKEKKLYQLERKTPVKEDFPFCGIIIKLFIFAFIVFFAIDFYSELQTQHQRKTNQITQCYQDYVENKYPSEQFVAALIEQCQQLQFCASRDPIKMTKVSDVFVTTIMGLFGKVAQQLTYVGVGLIVLLVMVYLYRPAMYHEQRINKFQ